LQQFLLNSFGKVAKAESLKMKTQSANYFIEKTACHSDRSDVKRRVAEESIKKWIPRLALLTRNDVFYKESTKPKRKTFSYGFWCLI